MAEFDTVIAGGTIVDGTRMPRYRADIGIKDGLIVAIGKIDAKAGAKRIDASGLIVAPGFIDLHTHYDAPLFWDPYCTLSGWHGVTSVVIGNCGFGFAPVRPEDREAAMMSMTRVEAIPFEAMKAALPWDWVTYPEFLDSVERQPKGVNVLSYVPIAPLISWVMGADAKTRKPTEAETEEICRLLDEALEAGGCGFAAQRLGPESLQRDYDGTPMVTDVMHSDTALALAGVLAKRNAGFIAMNFFVGHPKDYLAHLEDVAIASGRPLLWQAITPDDLTPERHRFDLQWIAGCQARGIRIFGQGITVKLDYTFTLGEWNLFDMWQPWRDVTLGSVAERKAKMADPTRREALRANTPTSGATAALPDMVVLETFLPAFKKYESRTLADIARDEGRHPVDVMLDLAVAEDLRTIFYAPATNNGFGIRKELAESPYVLPGVSDGGAHSQFITAGRYPTEFLIDYVRDNAVLTLEEAHWRLSALPAYCAGLTDRGSLREGSAADLVIYDLDRLAILPTEVAHDLPAGEWRRIARAAGYRHILVNGQTTFTDGRSSGATPGKLLRQGKSGVY